ncbi:hypothetical protein [Dictyobacter formicarum]|uniref:Uncharacterized protein n=1 Tax=Dictyobacter formicarum TaxID=2778368 RepID=A0ABQ3VHR3_9CHLR|nr:hypothetical protein [Dictyobacter formicarum]GHO85239.1 hypothetical protein KSZ_32450 [Dictyobacter formicarum]
MTPGEEKLMWRWFDIERLAKVAAQRRSLLIRLQVQEILTGDHFSKTIPRVQTSITTFDEQRAAIKYNAATEIVGSKCLPAEIIPIYKQVREEILSRYTQEKLEAVFEQIQRDVAFRRELRAEFLQQKRSK